MARKALEITTDGEIVRTPDLVEASEVATTPTLNAIPRADENGEIAAGWIPAGARTINVEEADGSPSLTQITKLVVGTGDLTNLGGGAARLKTAADAEGGSGGSPLTIEEADGSPQVANVSTIIVGNGDLTDNGNGVVRLKTAADAEGSGGGGDGIGGMLYLWAQFI